LLELALSEYLVIGKQPSTPITVDIVSLDPLQISDDSIYFLEVPGLECLVDEECDLDDPSIEDRHLRIELLSWYFEMKRVPNSDDLYLDVEANSLRYTDSI